MSGGSMDYLYLKVEDEAHNLIASKCPKRIAFGEHLLLIAKALHDIEWVDSADKSEGSEIESIMKCITRSDVLKTLLRDAKKMSKELQILIDDIESKS